MCVHVIRTHNTVKCELYQKDFQIICMDEKKVSGGEQVQERIEIVEMRQFSSVLSF